MSEPYSCRAIGTLVAMGLGFLVISTVIALSTYEEECGFQNGYECRRDPGICSGSHECYCPGGQSRHRHGTCEHAEYHWNGAAEFFIGVFSLLFWGFTIASIVFCACRCVHREDHEKVHNVYFIPAETYFQGGKL